MTGQQFHCRTATLKQVPGQPAHLRDPTVAAQAFFACAIMNNSLNIGSVERTYYNRHNINLVAGAGGPPDMQLVWGANNGTAAHVHPEPGPFPTSPVLVAPSSVWRGLLNLCSLLHRPPVSSEGSSEGFSEHPGGTKCMEALEPPCSMCRAHDLLCMHAEAATAAQEIAHRSQECCTEIVKFWCALRPSAGPACRRFRKASSTEVHPHSSMCTSCSQHRRQRCFNRMQGHCE